MPKTFSSKDMFDRIIDQCNLEKALNKSLKGDEKYSVEAMMFTQNVTENLMEVRRRLVDETYKFSGYMRFTVHEPKERIIDAPHFKDKIVQLSINNVLKEYYNPKFIYDSYACIDNKGTHKAVDRISYFMRKAAWEYGEEATIIKIDIEKFFYTIDREILKEILKKRIKCRKTLRLIFKIIDSADALSEVGLPLGNTLSQICANIYMNELDQYCKRKKGVRYYLRYADDVFMIARDKRQAKELLDDVKLFLKTHLHLKTNEKKTKIFPISQGVNTIGYKVHKTHRILRNDCKKKIKRKAKKMRRLLVEGIMKPEKAEQILSSWYGHAKHGCSYNFMKKLIAKNDYIHLDKNGNMKVNEDKIRKEGAENALLERRTA